jgi:hypothetical protein
MTIHRSVADMVDRPVVQARYETPAATPEQSQANAGPSPLQPD